MYRILIVEDDEIIARSLKSIWKAGIMMWSAWRIFPTS